MTGVVLCVVRRPRLTLLIAGLLVAACAGLAAQRLTISTDQNELFSPRAPFFRDYLGFVGQFPENEALYALLEPANPAHRGTIPVQRWTAAADAIAAKVASLGHAVHSVDRRIPLDQLGLQGLLFEDPDRLSQTVEE